MTRLGLGEAGLHVPAADLVRRELLGRDERVEDRLEPLGPQADPAARLTEQGAVGCREERHRLGVVADDLAGERRLVGLDGADDVLAGDVLGGEHDDLRPVEARIELDAEEAGVRLGGADRGAVPGARIDEVVRVERGAGQLVGPLAPQRGRRRSAEGRKGRRPGGRMREHDGRRLGQGPSLTAWSFHVVRCPPHPSTGCRGGWVEAARLVKVDER